MTDRELLELAAKAAGIRYTVEGPEYYKTRKFFGLWLVYYTEPSEYARYYWNPLTSDGDALRLAVTLDLNVNVCNKGTFVSRYELEPVIAEKNRDDPYAATRRAIVRAAAEIGKGMK